MNILRTQTRRVLSRKKSFLFFSLSHKWGLHLSYTNTPLGFGVWVEADAFSGIRTVYSCCCCECTADSAAWPWPSSWPSWPSLAVDPFELSSVSAHEQERQQHSSQEPSSTTSLVTGRPLSEVIEVTDVACWACGACARSSVDGDAVGGGGVLGFGLNLAGSLFWTCPFIWILLGDFSDSTSKLVVTPPSSALAVVQTTCKKDGKNEVHFRLDASHSTSGCKNHVFFRVWNLCKND